MFHFLAKSQAGCRRGFLRHLLHRITTPAFFIAIAVIPQLIYTPILNAKSSDRPNIVLIMADDLGYGDLSCYGSESIHTPVLDQLASDGMRLTDFYAGCTVCTPSRMALLTGAYPPRAGWRGGVVGYGLKTVNGLAPSALTMGEIFQAAGYRTGLIGKWHLGDTPQLSPMNQGFDSTFYINKSNNQTKQLWRGEKVVADPFDNRRLTERFCHEAIQFISRNRERPFFLYLPFTAPHFPAQAHPDWDGKSGTAAYGDVVQEMDHRVGQILAALEEHQLEGKTIVIFLSDNGVEPGQKKWARSTPFRGLKWSSLEGGNRVPCIVRWPGRIPAGKTNSELTAAIDLLPTLAKACQIRLPDNIAGSPKLDGVDVLGTLESRADFVHPRTSLLVWHGWGTLQAIRVGDWKLYLDEIKELPATKTGPMLVNLADDPAEQSNLSERHPDKVAAMLQSATQQLAEIRANAIQIGGPVPAKGKIPKQPRWLP